MKVKRKKKSTCHFSLEWKKIPAEGELVKENHPRGRKRRQGKERKERVKPQGSEVAQYFIHRASPE